MNKLKVSSSPHIRSSESTTSVMFDVLIAMLPALIGAVYFFGFRALVLTLISVVSCVIFEFLWQKLIVHKKTTVADLSAVVTGVLIAFNLPVTVPYRLPVVGAFVAIVIVKQMFGGIGCNFMNPALAARAFLLASWAGDMTTWAQPRTSVPVFGSVADVATGATPLGIIGEGAGVLPDLTDTFMGNIGGCLGETSVILLLIGGLYLIIRKIIKWQVPVVFIGTVFVMTYLFGYDNFISPFNLSDALYSVTIGGVFLGAFFMATDYVTTPMTLKGQIIFAFGCGFITSVIRIWGGYPEGVSYSILLMNILTPFIDKIAKPKVFGRRVKSK